LKLRRLRAADFAARFWRPRLLFLLLDGLMEANTPSISWGAGYAWGLGVLTLLLLLLVLLLLGALVG